MRSCARGSMNPRSNSNSTMPVIATYSPSTSADRNAETCGASGGASRGRPATTRGCRPGADSLDGLTIEVAASPVGLVVAPLVPVEGAEGLDGARLFAARDELAQRDCQRLLLS